MTILSTFGGTSGVDTGDIGHSLRFRRGASAYANRTPASTTDRTRWTYSAWVKPSDFGSDNFLFGAAIDANNRCALLFNSGSLVFFSIMGGTTRFNKISSALFRDPTAFYHIVCAFDSTNATTEDRVKLYVNNTRITSWSTNTFVDLTIHAVNDSTAVHTIGRRPESAANYFDGYMSRIAFVDGQALTPSSFGYLNTEINEWVSKSQSAVKAVVDAGGTNSFMLDFDDATSLTTLGYDKSSKGNNWTLNNFSLTAGTTYDHMLDVPGNSFATLNPLDAGGTLTLSNANLYGNNAGASHLTRKATFALPATGKHYWELESGSTSGASSILGYGVALMSAATNAQAGNTGVFCMQNDASHDIWNGASSVLSTGGTVAAGVIRQVAYDADTGKIWFGEGDVWASSTDLTSGNPTAGTNPCITLSAGDYFPWMACYANSFHINFGQAPLHASATYHSAAGGYFRYTPPAGYKALCQRNLPDPAITNPELHFDVVTRSGDSSTTQTQTGIAFPPDLVWTKIRNNTLSHTLFDVIRGVGKDLNSNSNGAENSNNADGYLSVFTSDGYTMTNGATTGNLVKGNTYTYVDWLWKAGGAAVTNNAGSISSQVSANVEAGFSIVTYTGNSLINQSFGHGLSKAPSLVIIKNRGFAYDWVAYHAALGGTKFLYLNQTAAATTSSSPFNNTDPTSSVVTIAGNSANTYVNYTGVAYVAYCFAEIPGYSKIFSYTGNGSAVGPYVDCGFKPKFVLVKSSTGTESWYIFDAARNTYNAVDKGLFPNLSNAETTSYPIDFTANGFKLRVAGNPNTNTATYIGIAFADVSGKYSLGR